MIPDEGPMEEAQPTNPDIERRYVLTTQLRTNKSELLASQAHASQHYKGFSIEPLQYIEANGIGFHEGNIIKYVSRWRQKDGIDDLKKAKFYIERLIELAPQDR